MKDTAKIIEIDLNKKPNIHENKKSAMSEVNGLELIDRMTNEYKKTLVTLKLQEKHYKAYLKN